MQEIGYTDTIIDVRSSRVRQLLGIQSHGENDNDNRQLVNGEPGGKRPSESQGRRYGRNYIFSYFSGTGNDRRNCDRPQSISMEVICTVYIGMNNIVQLFDQADTD